MATMTEVIKDLEEVKPNAYSSEMKFKWMKSLDGVISTEVMREEAPEYVYPDYMDEPLLVGTPYDDIYLLYCSAMIDFHNREYDEYNASATLFHERLQSFKTWYIQEHSQSKARNFRNVMG